VNGVVIFRESGNGNVSGVRTENTRVNASVCAAGKTGLEVPNRSVLDEGVLEIGKFLVLGASVTVGVVVIDKLGRRGSFVVLRVGGFGDVLVVWVSESSDILVSNHIPLERLFVVSGIGGGQEVGMIGTVGELLFALGEKRSFPLDNRCSSPVLPCL